MRGGIVSNCTVTANSSGNFGGISAVQSGCIVVNTIIAGNTSTSPSAFFNEAKPEAASWGVGGTANVSMFVNCLVDAAAPNETCDTADAGDIFKSFANNDYHLKQGSPAVNAGPRVSQQEADAAGIDLDGNPRIFGLRMDIGCYELQHAGGTLLMVR